MCLYSFAGLIRLAPLPTFSNTYRQLIPSRHVFQLRKHLVRISWFARLKIKIDLCPCGSPRLLQSEPVPTLLHAHTRMYACTNRYPNLCAQPHTLLAFLADTGKQNSYKTRHFDERLHAIHASVVGRYFSSRYSHFCFRSEPYYFSWRGSVFHHVVRFPAIV